MGTNTLTLKYYQISQEIEISKRIKYV